MPWKTVEEYERNKPRPPRSLSMKQAKWFLRFYVVLCLILCFFTMIQPKVVGTMQGDTKIRLLIQVFINIIWLVPFGFGGICYEKYVSNYCIYKERMRIW